MCSVADLTKQTAEETWKWKKHSKIQHCVMARIIVYNKSKHTIPLVFESVTFTKLNG
ncbi:hypothetical protein GCM10007377_15640 [Galliscardovia ingluviei]|uniref:Uncharacterized protein n=1 Tax=Galliscardovia ingluviei TaxID=1769422 RepID=A0A8J3ARP7_9BIFI|nr:hypothetical protein GCM10007377_15640 [Galliscardovia ingluviei]